MNVTKKKPVRIGLVGAGFMGKCHANAFRAVDGLFDLPVTPRLELLADMDDASAASAASALGFRRSTGDWTALVADPDVDIVAITAPNKLHEPIAVAAAQAGKAVYCEKPLSTTLASAERMRDAVAEAGVVNLVGFNFLCNPMVRLARELIQGGEIGDVTAFRGRHAENYMARADAPHSFRTDPEGGGALADIGSHILSMARYVLGPIVSVCGSTATIHPERPLCAGSNETAPVRVDDHAQALLWFEGGQLGSVEANWAATGRTMDLSFEVTGTHGAISFSQERMNELLVYRSGGAAGQQGFTRIEAGPAHVPYGRFCPAPGHHLGFNDLKVIEVAGLLQAYATNGQAFPDFAEAYAVQATVEAIHASSRQITPTNVNR
ncbi:Gfo/Idh/MocA family protein [Salinisphaera hydrothermalis]|uniref:Gfo/Idh/MocA family protein n=1 Tax=Salinisphaera hydrothermalis TaxID=563188 RepID=UPI00333E7942